MGIRRVDLSEMTPDEALAHIEDVLASEPTATLKVYAGLAHKTWALFMDRQPVAEIREWWGLCLGVHMYMRGRDEVAASRCAALVDLLGATK